jgi:hypothetical protein
MEYVQKDFLKPLIGGSLLVAIDKFYVKETNMQRSLYFGAAGAAGYFLGGIVAQYAPVEEFNFFFSNGRNVAERFSEIAAGTGSVYILNKFVLKNELNGTDLNSKVMQIVAADIAAEMLSEFLLGEKPQII